MIKRLSTITDFGYGVFLLDDGNEYIFNYGVPKDKGMGVIVNSVTDEEFTIIDTISDNDGNVKHIIIEK